MKTLFISINNIVDPPQPLLQPLLQKLKDEKQLEVQLEVYDWGEALRALNKITTYRSGPVISQIGTTWMGDLAPQMALRAFSMRDIAAIGGQEIFYPAAWQTTRYLGTSETLSIPWLVDTNVIFYRRDALRRAGIKESTAFSSLEQLDQTIAALRDSGHSLPWVCSSGVRTLGTVHRASNWVFGRGGSFVSGNGRRAEFNSEAARAGFSEYFKLQRYLTPDVHNLNDVQAFERFFSGQAAVTLAPPSYIHRMRAGDYSPEISENTGVAVPPGVPFVGGSNWVIWNHISPALERTAIEFLAFMCTLEAQLHLHEEAGLLPARLDALAQSTQKDHYPAVQETLQKGRSFPATRLWGIVENRLSEALQSISEAIFDPNVDIEAALDEHLAPLERRLNMTLAS